MERSRKTENLTGLEIKVLQDLYAIKAIKFGNFRLKHHETNPEAPLSPLYIDLRVLRSYPDVLRLTGGLYEEKLRDLEYDILAEVPTAVTPITTVVSQDLDIGFRTVRNKKSHGTDELVDGFLPTDVGQTAVLLDDLITKANSKLEAIAVLNNKGIQVSDVVVLIDREQGGEGELEKIGVRLHSAFKLGQILDYYLSTRRIGKATYEEIKAYLLSS